VLPLDTSCVSSLPFPVTYLCHFLSYFSSDTSLVTSLFHFFWCLSLTLHVLLPFHFLLFPPPPPVLFSSDTSCVTSPCHFLLLPLPLPVSSLSFPVTYPCHFLCYFSTDISLAISLFHFFWYFPLKLLVLRACHFLLLPPAKFCVTFPLLRTNILMFAVSIVKILRAERQTNRVSNSGWRKTFSYLPNRPDRPRDWPILQFNGCQWPYLRH